MRLSCCVLACVFLLVLDVANAEEPWQRDQRPLLTNSNNMYNPCVLKTEGEYGYRMWFFGWALGPAGNPGVSALAGRPYAAASFMRGELVTPYRIPKRRK